MSYMSTLPSATLSAPAVSTRQVAQHAAPSVRLPTQAPPKVTAGLEILVLLTMLSGLSLTMCTIAAGAF